MRIKWIVAIALVLQGLVVTSSTHFSHNSSFGQVATLLPAAHADTSTTLGVIETSTPALIFPNVLNSEQPLIETGSAAGSQSITNYSFPSMLDEQTPSAYKPSVTVASTDTPKPYLDHCHVEQNLTATKASCIYGNPNSKTTIVLFGDSHALSWFPAIEQIAINHKWKLVSLTMSSCWPSSIPAWNPVTNELMKNCSIWRTATLKKIATLHPYLTFVAGTRGFETIDSKGNVLTGSSRQKVWNKGMNATLSALKSASQNLVYLSDYPDSLYAPEDCLGLNPKILFVCGTDLADAISVNWLNVERVTALNNGAIWINPTEWLCNTAPCSPLMNGYIIYRDGGHLTSTFARTLAAPLWDAVGPALSSVPTTASFNTKQATKPATSSSSTVKH
jgi:hypothetical protein